MKKEISKDLTIEEVLNKYPDKAQNLEQIMSNAGLHCAGCGAASFETLEEGMLAHGMPKKARDNLMKELNNELNEVKKITKGVTFTKHGAEKCKGFRKDARHMFKISLTEGECGWTYGFKFKEEKSDDEIEFKDKGVKILIDKNSLEKLNGIVIDYMEGMQGAGFKVTNPNSLGSCGCGSSVKL